MPPPDQAAVFRRLRLTTLRNSLSVLLRTGKVRLFTMLSTSAVVAGFVYALSHYGFWELAYNKVPLKGIVGGLLFDLLFFTLGGMLLFSTGIVLYASLFTAPEARFLLATPARADRIFATKFQAAVLFSSWAFVILGLPVLVAYGVQAEVPWYFYALIPLFLFGFVLLPGAVSATVCLLLVRFLPKNRKQAFGLLILGLVLVLGVWLVRAGLQARETFISGGKKDDVTDLLGQFQLTQSGWMPSHWMTTGLLAAGNDRPADAILPLALLWSNGLVAYLVAAGVAARTYRVAFDRVSGTGRAKKRYRANALDGVMEGLVFYLSKPVRLLVVKDFRTFRRDPTQWVLLFIFAGMMLLGAINFREFSKRVESGTSAEVLSVVNLAAIAVLLCAGLSRFIYPLMSLEGRKFWILGLMPIRREQILTGKFAFAATGTLIVAVTLTLVGDLLLGVAPVSLLVHLFAAVCVGLGLSGLNVGLGAAMPNFKETDPSKIVVGFGGTVNMIIGLGFLLLVVASSAGPVLAAGLRAVVNPTLEPWPWWAFAGLPVAAALTTAAVWVPLEAGARSLRNTEF
jgi:ABC-2 type transport system permease protein